MKAYLFVICLLSFTLAQSTDQTSLTLNLSSYANWDLNFALNATADLGSYSIEDIITTLFNVTFF